MRNTINENIAEHSLDVSIIAHALAIINNKYFDGDINAERVAVLSMFHDSTEIITGDLPTPIKYYAPDIKLAYKDIEKKAAFQLIEGLPEEIRKEYKDLLIENESEKVLWRYVKAADKISAYIKCIVEKQMGNKDFIKAEKATLKAIKDMKMPEADYFLINFLPAYTLTLDEQT